MKHFHRTLSDTMGSYETVCPLQNNDKMESLCHVLFNYNCYLVEPLPSTCAHTQRGQGADRKPSCMLYLLPAAVLSQEARYSTEIMLVENSSNREILLLFCLAPMHSADRNSSSFRPELATDSTEHK